MPVKENKPPRLPELPLFLRTVAAPGPATQQDTEATIWPKLQP